MGGLRWHLLASQLCQTRNDNNKFGLRIDGLYNAVIEDWLVGIFRAKKWREDVVLARDFFSLVK